MFELNMKTSKPIARIKDLVVQQAGDETLVYDLNSNKASCLNGTSALVWKNCDGIRSVSEIAAELSFITGKRVGDDLVYLSLDQLSRHKLLEGDVSEIAFNGMDRRSFAKKVGLTTAIALPIVATLIAPTSAHAASACVAGGTCTCNQASAGRVGQQCTPSVPCTDINCRCVWANNGNANGTCVV
jgi:hypothetical protein